MSMSMRSGTWNLGSAKKNPLGIGQSVALTGDGGILALTCGTIKQSTSVLKLLYLDWRCTVIDSLVFVISPPMPQTEMFAATRFSLRRFAIDLEIKFNCDPVSKRMRHGTGRWLSSSILTTAV